MTVLIICPIPPEYSSCRQALSLRDGPFFQGCKTARGSIGNTEVLAVQSGPAKSRAAALTAAACLSFQPDLVVDSGSCAGLLPGADVGEVVIGELCYEYDLGGSAFPTRSLKEMRLPSGFTFLHPRSRELLQREAVSEGRRQDIQVRIGVVACGEVLVQSLELRDRLYTLFHAAAADWETAGVFVAALRASIPPLSMRIVTDLGGEDALSDFRRHVQPQSRALYGYIALLLETGWFGRFQDGWAELEGSVQRDLSARVLP